MKRIWATATATAALLLIGAGQALAAGTVNVTIKGVGTVSGSVTASGAEFTCTRDAAGVQSGTCSMFVPNERICEGEIPPGARPAIPPCIILPGVLDLHAADAGSAYGFTHWEGRCTGTARNCTIVTPKAGTNVYAVTANFGDTAPPSVELTAPGGGFVRGAVTVAAGASDNFGVARVDLSLAGATKAATGAPFAATFDSAQLPDGPTTATARATDVSGHASATASSAVTIDNTPPAVTVTGPNDRTFAPGSTQVWVVAPSDATSGVASLQCSVVEAGKAAAFRACSGSPTVEIADNRPPGSYRFTARVTDKAGNVADATRDFRVAATLESAAAANGGKLPGSDGSVTGEKALTLLPITLSYSFDAKRRGTRFSALTLKRVPRGATVSVTCTKGCPRKAYKNTKPAKTFRVKPYLNKWLRPGAVLTVTVAKPGALTVIKKFTIRRGTRPRLESLCQAPEAAKPQRC